MKRYDLETHGRPYMQREEMTERPDGEWVRFEDVEPLIAALRELNELVVFSNQKRIIDSAIAKLGETP